MGGGSGDHGLVALPPLVSLPSELSGLLDEENAHPGDAMHASLEVPADRFARETTSNVPSSERAGPVTYVPPSFEVRYLTPLESRGDSRQTGGTDDGAHVHGDVHGVHHEDSLVTARASGNPTEALTEG